MPTDSTPIGTPAGLARALAILEEGWANMSPEQRAAASAHRAEEDELRDAARNGWGW